MYLVLKDISKTNQENDNRVWVSIEESLLENIEDKTQRLIKIKLEFGLRVEFRLKPTHYVFLLVKVFSCTQPCTLRMDMPIRNIWDEPPTYE